MQKKISAIMVAIVAAVCLITVICSAIPGTFAWQSLNQSVLNEIFGKKDVVYQAELVLYEKLHDGTETTNPLENGGFQLYNGRGNAVGGNLVTDAQGKISVENLKPGDYYFKAIAPAEGYTFDYDDKGTDITEYHFVISDGDALVIAYNRPPVGELVLSKTVENADGTGLTEHQKTVAFTFTVTFSDGGTYPYTIGETSASLDSGGTLELKHSESAVFDRLPIGVEYTVAETAVQGYRAKQEQFEGTISDESAQAAFINVFHPEEQPETVEIRGEKTWELHGADVELPESITVLLKRGSEVVETKTVKVDDQGKWLYAFTVPKFDESGKEIVYTIEEEAVSGFETSYNGYNIVNSYKSAETVTIKGQKTWKLNDYKVKLPESITVYLKDGNKVIDHQQVKANGEQWNYSFTSPKYDEEGKEIDYTIMEAPVKGYKVSYDGYDITNTYIAEETVTIRGEKSWALKGHSVSLPGSVKIRLMAGYDVIAEEKVKPDQSGHWKYSFTVPKYDDYGNEIDYKVREIPVEGYYAVYDGYNIENRFIEPITVALPKVTKKLSGWGHAPDNTFTFEMKGALGIPMPEGSNGNIKTRNIRGKGQTDFGKLTFTAPGTYVYTFREINGGSEGWFYDASIYLLTYTVTAEHDKLAVKTELYCQGQSAEDVVFTNYYEPPTGPVLNTYDHMAYIIGYPDGTVRPERLISRAEVATIFFRLLTEESRNEYMSFDNEFSDVTTKNWYNCAVSTLANAGIINGYPDGTFKPDAPITRAEMATIAARFDIRSNVALDMSFSDISGHWAEKYILKAASRGWVNGYTDGTFCPDNNIKRNEAMKLVNYVLGRVVNLDGLAPIVRDPDYNVWIDNSDQTQWYYDDVQEATNSHDYTRTDQFVPDHPSYTYEEWYAVEPAPDWAALEKTW